jgi:hypothetical protein
LKKLRAYIFSFLRVIAVLLSLTLDIRVHADVTIKKAEGKYELEKSGKSVAPQVSQVLQEPLSFETFKESSLKFFFNLVFIGISEQTLIDLNLTPELTLYKGKALINVVANGQNSNDWFMVRTANAIFKTSDAEFIIDLKKEKSVLTVLSGKVVIEDRASQKKEIINAGYTTWVGGLLLRGEHARGNLEAIDFVETLKTLRDLSLLSNFEIQAKSDQLKPLWRKAVDAISENNQREFEKDFANLARYDANTKKLSIKRAHDEAELRRYFRHKTLGIPDEPR